MSKEKSSSEKSSNTEKTYNNKDVLKLLDEIYQEEVAGVNRYLHYSFMIMGYNRIPIQKWFRDNATEAMGHAVMVGEKMTSLGGHPTLRPAEIEERNNHDIKQLLKESLKFEEKAIGLYKKLTQLATDLGDIALEELARGMVRDEVEHADEVKKMLTSPEH